MSIKENRPKGKIGLKKKNGTKKKTKKKTVQRNRKQRRRESNPDHLHVASNSLTIAPQCWTCFDKLILLYQNQISLLWTLFEAGEAVFIMN